RSAGGGRGGLLPLQRRARYAAGVGTLRRAQPRARCGVAILTRALQRLPRCSFFCHPERSEAALRPNEGGRPAVLHNVVMLSAACPAFWGPQRAPSLRLLGWLGAG